MRDLQSRALPTWRRCHAWRAAGIAEAEPRQGPYRRERNLATLPFGPTAHDLTPHGDGVVAGAPVLSTVVRAEHARRGAGAQQQRPFGVESCKGAEIERLGANHHAGLPGGAAVLRSQPGPAAPAGPGRLPADGHDRAEVRI